MFKVKNKINNDNLMIFIWDINASIAAIIKYAVDKANNSSNQMLQFFSFN